MDSGGLSPGEAMDAERAWALLPAVMAAVVGTPWWQGSEDVLVERIRLLARVENQVSAAQVAAVREGLARGMPARAGCKTGGAWLRGLVPVTPYVAGLRARLAATLAAEDLAPTEQAFGSGAISVGHAGAITRTMTALDAVPEVDATTWAEAQQVMVGEAGRLDPAQLGRLGHHLRNRLDPDGAARLARDEDRQQDARSATLVQEGSGMWFLTATLPAQDGAVLATALDVLARPQPGHDGTPDPRSRGQRTADALAALAELSLAQRAGQPDGLPARHGCPVRLVVTADIHTLLADLTRKTGQAGLPPASIETGEPGGWDASALTAQLLLCDAEVVPAVMDRDGRILDVGHSQYRFPLRIRRAIEYRDRQCTFPNCQAPPSYCHTHHLIPFGRNGQAGGPTAEANGTLLCGRHHRFVHANAWTGHLIEGHVQWRPPRPGAPPQPANDIARQIHTKLRQLTQRWLTRNAHLHNAEPHNTS